VRPRNVASSQAEKISSAPVTFTERSVESARSRHVRPSASRLASRRPVSKRPPDYADQIRDACGPRSRIWGRRGMIARPGMGFDPGCRPPSKSRGRPKRKRGLAAEPGRFAAASLAAFGLSMSRGFFHGRAMLPVSASRCASPRGDASRRATRSHWRPAPRCRYCLRLSFFSASMKRRCRASCSAIASRMAFETRT